MLKLRWILTLVLAFSSVAKAQYVFEQARSIRSLAMGGVVTPFVQGAEAVFYNPAALSRVKGLDIQLANIGVGYGGMSIEEIQSLQNIDPNDPSTFNQLYGKRLWVGANAKAAVAFPYFGVGYMNDGEVSLELHNPALPQFNTYFRNDATYYLSGAFPLGPIFSFGMTAKRINRWGGDSQELDVTDIAGSSNLSDIGDHFSNKGQGYGMDVALMAELDALVLRPTIALVWQDVGNTAFTKTAGTDAPSHINQNLSLGAGMLLDLPGLDVSLGGEVRHLMEPDIQIGKKLHLGAEVSLPIIDLRAGYNQGYLTYGVGVNLLIFRIDAVSYAEELGVYPGQNADNRYMVGISIDLGFDADFKFTDNNGKKRKVKQRR
ncbi:MAG: hypothetical protein J7501_12060 [Bdellovibrio sp.]|nr:hypothetical protein [Bdellovibrio sp.]